MTERNHSEGNKAEGAMDKAKGRLKEASEALTDDREDTEKKSGRQDRSEAAIC